ncbi:MAG: four helix bundle protein [Bacteroidota bacterium]
MPSNISEGAGQNTNAQFKHFLENFDGFL